MGRGGSEVPPGGRESFLEGTPSPAKGGGGKECEEGEKGKRWRERMLDCKRSSNYIKRRKKKIREGIKKGAGQEGHPEGGTC